MIVWVDGRLGPDEDVRVSPLDRGLLVGDGVFETLRVYSGVPFAWRRHHERLRASAEALGLSLPDPAVTRAAADEVIRANGLSEARLRLTVTAGAGPPGSSRARVRPTLIVAATALGPADPTVSVVLAPWTRNEHGATAGLKTVSYAANVRALAYAEERGAGEALFANTSGNLCEATGSNVFVVLGGVLHTPPATAGCLLGVTRALALELARVTRIPTEEVDVPLAALRGASEAFLSSTTREVQAIASIDGRPLPAAPGPVTETLRRAFADLVARDLDP